VVCIDDEIPFEIPQGWEWCRIKHIFTMQAGKNITAKRIHTTQSEKYKYPCFGGNGLRGYVTNYNTEGTFSLVGRQGALCGNVNIVSGKFYATEHAVVTDGYGLTDTIWMYFFLQALNLNQYATATAQPGLAVSNIIEVFIPLPPIAEQYRIVEKIQKLLPIIKQYSNAQIKLNILNKNIKIMMRKSVLQEAIQGKLVPQDPNDEPASVLLQRIKEEKLRLVKEGKLKKKDVVDSIIFKGDDNKYYEQIGEKSICIDNEVPFEIPESWQWCRIGTICIITNGFTPLRTEDKFWLNGDINWFTIDDIRTQGEYINFTKQKITKEATTPKRVVREGSILLCCTASVGQCAFTKIPITTNQQFNALTIKDDFCPLILDEYLFVFAKTLKDELHRLSGKTTFEFVSVKKISNLLIPIPPLNEQARIITCVKQALSSIMSR